ncbi:MAG: CAP domain-containing protein [Marmoricola sp.]
MLVPVAARTRRTPATTARWSGSLRTSDRSRVNAAFWSEYAPGLSTPSGYTGEDERCVPGTISPTAREATLRALNFVRSLGGLAPVTFSAALDQGAQKAALIMSANDRLDHSPSRSFKCWTSEGAAAAGRSNLSLSHPWLRAGAGVDLGMEDDGAGNEVVGHRRWLMNPFSTAMGNGATDNANAITVVGPTSSSRPNPAWVAWPTAGYFPDALEPKGRWSLSAGDPATDFRRARVQVTRNGERVRVTKNPVHDGYAQPTLVWEMPDSIARSGTFEVVVSRIRRSGFKKRFASSYSVSMFTPTR